MGAASAWHIRQGPAAESLRGGRHPTASLYSTGPMDYLDLLNEERRKRGLLGAHQALARARAAAGPRPARCAPCTACGKQVETRGKNPTPTCRACKQKAARKRLGPDAPRCPQCGDAYHEAVKGVCRRCNLQNWRAAHGVSGHQRIGRWTQARTR